MQSYVQDIEKLLREENYIQIKPQGYSMYPILVPARDEVVVAPVKAHIPLKRNDVVLYRRLKENGEKDILVLHRIWKINEQGIYLVGDNQAEIEGPLKREQMLGIMVRLIRNGKDIEASNLMYRMLTGTWLWLRPMRPVISKIAAKIKRIFNHKKI